MLDFLSSRYEFLLVGATPSEISMIAPQKLSTTWVYQFIFNKLQVILCYDVQSCLWLNYLLWDLTNRITFAPGSRYVQRTLQQIWVFDDIQLPRSTSNSTSTGPSSLAAIQSQRDGLQIVKIRDTWSSSKFIYYRQAGLILINNTSLWLFWLHVWRTHKESPLHTLCSYHNSTQLDERCKLQFPSY